MDKKFCDQAFTCMANFPTDQGVTFEQAFGASAMQCYADSEMYNMPAAVEAAITAGKITFSGSDAAACVNGITFPACATYWTDGPNMPAACGSALVGNVADGGDCTVDYECTNLQSNCDATTKKCTVDTMMRTTPSMDVPLHMQSTLRTL